MQLSASQLTPQTHTWLSQRPKECSSQLLVGQQRALNGLTAALRQTGAYGHCFAIVPRGFNHREVFDECFATTTWQHSRWFDWLYLADPDDALRPLCVNVPSGNAFAVIGALQHILQQPLDQRDDLVEELVTSFDTRALRDYIQRVKQKTFDDFASDQFATVIVGHEHPAPYYYCDRVSESQLFGQMGVQSIGGTVRSDLHLLEPGWILKANGGVLAIDIDTLLDQPAMYKRLKEVLKSGYFEWPQPTMEAGAAYFYRPEPVPIDIKIILVGSRSSYATLTDYDDDFSDLFPFLADFQSRYDTTQQPVSEYFKFLDYVWDVADVLPLTEDAYAAVLTELSRWAEHQHELSLDAIALLQLLKQANAVAAHEEKTQIDSDSIRSAVKQQRERGGYIEEVSRRSILNNEVRIDTAGEVVGQVNGLTVVSVAGVEFGEPSRITATIHYGDGDIIDIERKSELSGNIHTKGVMILSAYLAHHFARHEPMSVSATVVFEQSYHEVDGDSASLGELCCLISALADVPFKQSVALTGAIDQFGQVQAIGGVNEKIEGFFDLCALRGLDGNHRVLIPESNQKQLVLRPDIVQAVEQGQFHIHTVDHVDEALSYLCDMPVKDLYRQVKLNAHHEQESENRSWWQRWFS